MGGRGVDRRGEDSPPASTVSSGTDENQREIELSRKQQNAQGVHALDVQDGKAPPADTKASISPSTSPSLCMPRWAIIIIYCIYGFLTGAAYFNWTPMADMLYSDGAFEWLCSTSSLQAFEKEGGSSVPSTRPRCISQELAVGRLFSAMSASEFAFSAFAGVLFDSLGPKMTACIGTLMALGGWSLLAIGSRSLNTFIAASIFLGGSSEMCFYPMLPAANLYPGRENTVMAIFGAFRSMSFVIPLVMRAVNIEAGVSSFRNVLLGFACICTGGCFLLALIFIPRKPWPKNKMVEKDDREDGVEEEEKKKKKEEGGVIGVEGRMMEISSDDDETGLVVGMHAMFRKSFLSFIREACSLTFAPMAIAYSLIILMIMFYVPSTLHLIPDAYAANQVIQIFSFLPCPLLGYAADRIGILWVMQFINLCGFASYFFATTPSIPTYRFLQYTSAVFSALQVSFMNSQLYCYGTKYLSQQNLGKLIGTAFCFAGFLSLVTNPMREYALSHGFQLLCLLLMGISVVVAFILGFLQILEKKKEKKGEKKQRQTQQLDLAAGEEIRADLHQGVP